MWNSQFRLGTWKTGHECITMSIISQHLSATFLFKPLKSGWSCPSWQYLSYNCNFLCTVWKNGTNSIYCVRIWAVYLNTKLSYVTKQHDLIVFFYFTEQILNEVALSLHAVGMESFIILFSQNEPPESFQYSPWPPFSRAGDLYMDMGGEERCLVTCKCCCSG